VLLSVRTLPLTGRVGEGCATLERCQATTPS
jgi:hypothetical protein